MAVPLSGRESHLIGPEQIAQRKRSPSGQTGLIGTDTQDIGMVSHRILHLECARHFGGSVTCLRNFLAHAHDRSVRHAVVVYTPFPEARALSRSCDGVYVPPYTRPETAGSWTARAASSVSRLQLLVWLYSLIREHRIALVRLNNSPTVHVPAVLAARLADVPCIAWLRSFPNNGEVGKRLSHRLVTKYVAVSDAVRSAYIAAGLPSERIVTIYDGTEVPPHGPEPTPQGTFTVGTLGRLVRWKGLLDLIDAARIVTAEAAHVRFEIVGNADSSEPGFRSELAEVIRQRHLEGCVTIGDFIGDTQPFLRRIDCLANPSSPAEPFGMSIIEAMAASRPVIATRGGGPSEIIEDGISGLLTNPGDPRALAEAILRLVRDRRLCLALGRAGRERVLDRFEVRRQVSEQETLLRETTHRRAPGVRRSPWSRLSSRPVLRVS